MAEIILEDGTHLYGESFGAEGKFVGEIIFNTCMTGYQEVITDPSYAGQIIVFTLPHIGIVSDRTDQTSGRPLVIHNIGAASFYCRYMTKYFFYHSLA